MVILASNIRNLCKVKIVQSWENKILKVDETIFGKFYDYILCISPINWRINCRSSSEWRPRALCFKASQKILQNAEMGNSTSPKVLAKHCYTWLSLGLCNDSWSVVLTFDFLWGHKKTKLFGDFLERRGVFLPRHL